MRRPDSSFRSIATAVCLATLAAPLMISCAPEPVAQTEPFVEIRNPRNEADARLIDALADYIPHVTKNRGTPGLNVAVARGGEIIWEAGFGYADLADRAPMTPDTVCHSGSMGKTYVATAVMQLVERGAIGLDDEINQYLTEFQVTNPLGDREITFKDLLTHTSGMISNMAGPRFDTPKPLGEHLREGYAQEFFQPYNGTLLPRWSAKVGETFQYSNFGMATLGYLVEVTNPEGLSFSDYVQKHIMDPLSMTSSQYPPVQDAVHVRPEIFERMSTGYAKWGHVDVPTVTMYFADYPAGTVVTVPRDHIKLLLAYMNDGSFNGYQLLKPETVELMLQPHREDAFGGAELAEMQLGLVWLLHRHGRADFRFSHGGAHMYGWNNDFLAYPGLDFAVAVFTNHWGMGTVDRENLFIADFIKTWILNEEPFVEPTAPSPDWTWKTSYVIGLLMTEQLMGVLGIPEPLTPEMVEAMATGALPRSDAYNSSSGWDPDGFRTGVEDMLAVEMTMDGERQFWRSEDLKVGPDELGTILIELGGTVDSPYYFLLAEYLREIAAQSEGGDS